MFISQVAIVQASLSLESEARVWDVRSSNIRLLFIHIYMFKLVT